MADWITKRFWKNATVSKADGGYQVLLDARKLRTPAKSELIVPSHEMAAEIAAEWQAQDEKIDPLSMPFTRSANAAIDKVAPMHAEVCALVSEYGGSDLLCYRATTPEELVQRQKQAWDPLLDWAADQLSAPLKVTGGIMPIKQDAKVLKSLADRVADMSPFQLAAFHDLVGMSGSLIIGFAVTRKLLPTAELWQRSRIDEDWQIEQWGDDDEALAAVKVKKTAFEHAEKFFFLDK